MIRGGICHSIYRYAKTKNKYMKNPNKDIESSYLKYLDAYSFNGWGMSQKLPLNGFKWIKHLPKFDENLEDGVLIFDTWKVDAQKRTYHKTKNRLLKNASLFVLEWEISTTLSFNHPKTE